MAGTRIKKELLDGVVETAEVLPEKTNREVIKILKTVSVTRTPDTLIGQFELQTKGGLYELEIDEPTVRALVRVFDDFHAAHQDKT